MKTCPRCSKDITENQETRTRKVGVFHLSCAPRVEIDSLFRLMEIIQLAYGVEFRFGLEETDNLTRHEVRVVKQGIRISRHTGHSAEYALDAALETWRQGKTSLEDLAQFVADGGHGLDCEKCTEKDC